MKSEFAALQGTIHDLTRLKQLQFEQKRMFILSNYIIKMASIQIQIIEITKKKLKHRTFKN